MPNDIVAPHSRLGCEPMEIYEQTYCHKKREPRDRLKAYEPCASLEALETYRTEYNRQRDVLQNLSFTEYVAFIEENKTQVLQRELILIRTKYFDFSIVQHCKHLVEFYTGLPNASHFDVVNCGLHRWIFLNYIEWEPNEKCGFPTHTMMALMKLRLNMTDEELANRFGIEPYMVKMTLRLWLPGLYNCAYKSCESLYRNPSSMDDEDDYRYSKVLDLVEVCFETPEYTRRLRDNKHEARKAVIAVRKDGLLTFAGAVVSCNRPDDETIKRCSFRDNCYNLDLVAVHPEHLPAITYLGIAGRGMTNHSECNIKDVARRMSRFKILQAIPQEYPHEYIFPVCAALSNFYVGEFDGQEVGPADGDF